MTNQNNTLPPVLLGEEIQNAIAGVFNNFYTVPRPVSGIDAKGVAWKLTDKQLTVQIDTIGHHVVIILT